MQPVHLVREAGAGVAVEPVGDQEDDRPLPQDPAGPQPVELGDRMADAGPARPVDDRFRDPVERDVIQNVYIREVEKRDGKLVNVDIGEVKMVKDPWKIDNPPKSN